MNITIAQMVISYIMSSPYLRHVKCPTSVDDDHRPLKVKTLNTQFVPENHWENYDETWWPRQGIYHHLSCTFPASGPKFAGTITDYTNIQVMCAPACLKSTCKSNGLLIFPITKLQYIEIAILGAISHFRTHTNIRLLMIYPMQSHYHLISHEYLINIPFKMDERPLNHTKPTFFTTIHGYPRFPVRVSEG